MQISITGKQHLEVQSGLKEYIEERILKMQHFFSAVDESHIVLKVEKYLSTAEVSVNGQNIHLYAEGSSEENLYVALDRACDRIETQLKKKRERITEHKAPRAADVVEENTLVGDVEESPKLIRETYETKPMSLEEAKMQFDLSNKDLWVFQNAETEWINVLFKKENGDFGLIEPEA